MEHAWKVVVWGLAAALVAGCGDSKPGPQGAPAARIPPADVVEKPESSPLDGHYERTGASKASLDVLKVGPDMIRIRGFAGAEVAGVARIQGEGDKAHFENMAGCKLDMTFKEGGLEVVNTTACGTPNVNFDGTYSRNGPADLRSR